MGNPNKVFDGFFELYKKLGSEAEAFINIEKLWSQDNRLNSWRQSTERHISKTYLPGFKFENQAHFLWHFKNRDDPFLLLRSRRKPQSYIDFWLRGIFVPNVTHYKAEIALSMKAWDEKHRWKVKNSGNWNKCWTWPERVIKVLSIRDLQGGTRPHWPDVTPRTIYSWRQKASEYREQRRNSNFPSGWRIDCIEFSGDEKYSRYGDHMPVMGNNSDNTGFRETWIWEPIPGVDPPQNDIITFSAPAAADLWLRHWVGKKQSK